MAHYYGIVLDGSEWVPMSEWALNHLNLYVQRQMWLIIETSEPSLPTLSLSNVQSFKVITFPSHPQNCGHSWLNLWKTWRDLLDTHPGNLSSGLSGILAVLDGDSPTTQPTSSKGKNTFKAFIRKTMNTGSSS